MPPDALTEQHREGLIAHVQIVPKDLQPFYASHTLLPLSPAHVVDLVYNRADESITRVPIVASGIHCCLSFLLFLCSASASYIRISDSIETLYELPLLPNNTASETFLHKSGAVRSIDWIFIIGEPAECSSQHQRWFFV
jgi:hypothetical protein